MLHQAGYPQQGTEPYEDTQVNPENLRKANPWWQVYSFTAGAWFPQSNLGVLGVHPAIGVTGAYRNAIHEIDLELSFRFIRTPGDYLVERGDSLYSLHYYLGGHIGLGYTRYVFFSRRWEFGPHIGIGYDGFDIANDDGSGNYDYLSPIEINSFDYNLGMRFHFYFKDGTFLGLVPKYHFLHYANQGGSSLFGNAFSVDLQIGGMP
ncbi:MAG: hypothetical protein Q8943_13255 [Bacteroidota bacterium]|nr:hypothetical protein [Bacteroidota bacterium]